MSSRKQILNQLAHRCSHDQALQRPSPQLPEVGAITEWAKKLRTVYATVDEITGIQEVAESISGFLQQWQESEVILSPDPALTPLVALFDQLDIRCEQRPANTDDQIVMTVAYAGIIETGSLVLLSSPETPAGHNFLPECAIVLIQEGRFVPTLESLWGLMEAEGKDMPRALNIISGPSKTADIEQTLVYGAHGPKALHVLLVQDRA